MHHRPACYVPRCPTSWLWSAQMPAPVVRSHRGLALAESLRRAGTRALCWLVAVPRYADSSLDRIADNTCTDTIKVKVKEGHGQW